MRSMFSNAYSFNQNIGNWNVSNVRNMYEMFSGACNFNQNISRWCILPNTNVDHMFLDADSFNGDIVSGLDPVTKLYRIKIIYYW